MTKMDELNAQLAALNSDVDAAHARRRQWMDEHMADYAKYPIGETLFDRRTGHKLGKVVEHYRYHRDNPLYDTSMSIDYRFSNGDNTSCYGGSVVPCSLDELRRHYRLMANSL